MHVDDPCGHMRWPQDHLSRVAAVLTAISNGSGSGMETVIGKELKEVEFRRDYQSRVL
jgi:hypothetical protein